MEKAHGKLKQVYFVGNLYDSNKAKANITVSRWWVGEAMNRQGIGLDCTKCVVRKDT